MITFGKRDETLEYRKRTGVYGIIQDDTGRFLTVKNENGLFLIGGGVEERENLVDALKREALEETGYKIEIVGDKIGVAERHWVSATYPDWSQHNIGHFYRCKLLEKVAEPTEIEPIFWATLEELEQHLFHDHQLYMLRKSIIREKIQMLKQTMNEFLSDEVLKNALNFADFLEENDMTINGAEISHNGKVICYMHLGGNDDYPSPWTIWTEGDYSKDAESNPVTEQTKKIAWSNINHCDNCGAGCNPGFQKIIFDQTFEQVCNASMAFYKPDAENLEAVKKLLLIRKYEIEKSK